MAMNLFYRSVINSHSFRDLFSEHIQRTRLKPCCPSYTKRIANDNESIEKGDYKNVSNPCTQAMEVHSAVTRAEWLDGIPPVSTALAMRLPSASVFVFLRIRTAPSSVEHRKYSALQKEKLDLKTENRYYGKPYCSKFVRTKGLCQAFQRQTTATRGYYCYTLT